MLTPRDRALLSVLASVRYLSMDQVSRMFFPGRSPSTLYERVLKLAGLGKHGTQYRYLKRLQYRTFEGELVSVWALDALGKTFVQRQGFELPADEREVSANFLEHTIGLNELYARLYVAAGPRRLTELRWVAAGRVRLDWHEYVDIQRGRVPRRIEPDAIVELPSAGKRLLIEYETGANAVMSANREGASTVAKLRRYSQFLFGTDKNDRRHIRRVFPDELQPELVFIVPNATRQAGVTKLIREFQKDQTLPARAVFLGDLARELMLALGADQREPRAEARAEERMLLALSDRDQIVAFVRDAIRSLKGARHQIRAFNAKAGAVQLAEPDYPRSSSAVEALLRRWGAG